MRGTLFFPSYSRREKMRDTLIFPLLSRGEQVRGYTLDLQKVSLLVSIIISNLLFANNNAYDKSYQSVVALSM